MKNYLIGLVFVLLSHSLFSQCLSGSYTIGGSSPDYPTFNAAVSGLTTGGVCGPVIFNVRPGTYSEQITLPAITGTSATNTITFQSETGDSSSVILTFPAAGSTTNFVVKFNGADYVTFNKIHLFRNTSVLNSNVILITGNSDNLTFKHNWFKNLNTSGGDEFSGLIHIASSGNDYLKLFGNRFEQGCFALVKYDALFYSISFVADSNTFVDQYEEAILLCKFSGLTFKYNKEINITPNGGGLDIRNCNDSLNIHGNVITNLLSIYASNWPSLVTARIANNFVGPKGGIGLSSSPGLTVAFNSVYSDMPFYNGGSNGTVKNNLFNYRVSPPIFSVGSVYDNNVVLDDKPVFVSDTDYHVVYDDSIYSNASWMASVLLDFDGEQRDSISPCVGADEFMLPFSDPRVDAVDSISLARCGGTYDVFVNLYNGGSAALTSATVNWSLNGTLQTPYNWSGFLLTPNVTEQHINIGNANFPGNTSNILKFWITAPNTGLDTVPVNDTLTYIYTTDGLSGTYTVGGSSPDFATVDLAYTAIKSKGICGPVVFDLRPGTYEFTDTIYNIPGSSLLNTITFRSENGDSSSVILEEHIYPSCTWTIMLEGADHFIFDRLTIQNTSSGGLSGCIHFDAEASYNHIKNCYFLVDWAGSSSFYTIMVLGGTNNAFTGNDMTVGSNANYIVNAYEGSKMIMRNNYFHIFPGGADAIQAQLRKNDTIQNNTFSGGGVLISCDSSEFSNNNLLLGGGGRFGGKDLKIFNNFFTDRIIFTAAKSIFVHNTVKGLSSNKLISIIDSVYIQNNILSNSPGPIYDLYSSEIDRYQESNWNTMNSPGTYIYVGSTGYSLAAWKTLSGCDLNSLVYFPTFASATDLHLYGPGPFMLSTPSYPFCSKDIDGDLRNMLDPEVGADEFKPSDGNFDGAMNSMEMGANVCYGLQPVKVKIYNNENTISLTHAIVRWKVDGVSQPDYIWAGFVSPLDSSSILTIGSYFFDSGTHTIKAWIAAPNGLPDPNGTNDTLITTYNIYPKVDLGNDTTICEGGSLLLNAGTYVSYLWEDGSILSTYTTNLAGDHYVTVTDTNSCTYSDTINITIPIADFGNDTAICADDTLILDAGSDFTSFVWSTGASTQSINALPGSTYWVTGNGPGSCVSKDTITIASNPLPNIFLGNDTTFCAYTNILLNAGSGYASYHWKGGYTTSTLAEFGGAYGIPNTVWVTVTDNFGCKGRDTINLYWNVATATVTCSAGGAFLDAGPGFDTYSWYGVGTAFTSFTQVINPTVPDVFNLQVSLDGCVALGQFNVSSFSPSATFTLSATGLTVDFTPSTTGAIYVWNFGDGDSSNLESPTHVYPSSGTYLVTLTVYNACDTVSTNQSIVVSNVGIVESSSQQNDLLIYPNPGTGEFVLQLFLSEKDDYLVEVTDLLGKVVYRTELHQFQGGYKGNLDLSLEQSGLYFVKVYSSSTNLNKKLILAR